jgi:tetratricopeptide repeat protein 30
MRMDVEPSDGFRKLNFLISNPPFPPETFANLLTLYCKHQYYDLAADVLAENSHLTFKFLSSELYEFLDATLMVQTAPEEAYRKFDDLSKKHIETLRGLTKNIQDARLQRDNEMIKKSLKQYDEALERYIPVLMAQAKIYWDRDHSPMVERIFRQCAQRDADPAPSHHRTPPPRPEPADWETDDASRLAQRPAQHPSEHGRSAEFCSEHEAWKLNVAHVFFLQETKYKEAIRCAPRPAPLPPSSLLVPRSSRSCPTPARADEAVR